MPSLSEQLKHPTFDAMQCETRNGGYSCIDPHESNGIRQACNPLGEGGVSCKHPDLAGHIDDVGGLEFSGVPGIMSHQLTEFSDVIPVIDRGFFKQDGAILTAPVVAVTLEDILTKRPTQYCGQFVMPSDFDINTDVVRSPLLLNKRVILLMSGKDVMIEGFWSNALIKDFFPKIASMGFLAVTAVNFSIFYGDCPMIQATNLKKSQKSFEYLQQAGAKPILHTYFSNEYQVRRWAEFINAHPEINIIAHNCQAQRPADYPLVIEGLQLLTSLLNRRITLLLEGAKKPLLVMLSKLNADIITTTKRVGHETSAHQKLINYGGVLRKEYAPNRQPIELLNENLITYTSFLPTRQLRSQRF